MTSRGWKVLQPTVQQNLAFPPTLSSNPGTVPIIRLWSAMIRSLLWKRIVPVQDRAFIPIYAKVRDELANLIDSMDMSVEELTHKSLDALRHAVGLFASVF